MTEPYTVILCDYCSFEVEESVTVSIGWKEWHFHEHCVESGINEVVGKYPHSLEVYQE